MKKALALLVASLCAGLVLALGLTEEVPVGRVSGHVWMAENERPLSGVLVVLSPTIETPSLEDGYIRKNWHVKTGPDGGFLLDRIPSGLYRLEVAAKQHHLKTRVIDVQEGVQPQLNLDLTPSDPSLQIYASQKVLAPGSTAKLQMVGFGPLTSVALTIRRLRLEQIAKAGGVREALEPIAYQHKGLKQSQLDAVGTKVKEEIHRIGKRDPEGGFIEPLDVPALSEGLYAVTVAGGSLNASTFINVSKIGLITKTAGAKSLCYVTDLENGQPMAHVPLLTADSEGALTSRSTTDSSGLAEVYCPAGKSAHLIVAKSGPSIAVSEASFQTARETEHAKGSATQIFTYADRPVYKPGDTVQFKAIVRKWKNSDLVLPPAGTADVRVIDDQENLLQTQTLPIDSHGSANGKFSTSPEAKPGVYKLEIRAFGGLSTYYANLAAYRKPDYTVKVTPGAKRVSMGDSASATVECQYYFGGPVVGARVRASVYRSPAWSPDADDSDDTAPAPDEGGGVGGEFVQKVEAETDGTGKATLKFPTVSEHLSDGSFTDYRYSIQASVSSSGDHSFEGSASVLVTQGDIQLVGTTDPSFLAVGQRGAFTLHASTYDSPPRPLADKSISITIERSTYTAHTVVYEPLQKLTLTTDSKGDARGVIAPGKEGDLRIRATCADSSNRQIGFETFLWVSGSAARLTSTEPKIETHMDHRHYQVGETARVLVSTNNPGGVALLTVESDSIKLKRLVPLKSGSATVSFRVDKTMSPNAYVTASYIHKRAYSETSRNLNVARKDNKLKVVVRPRSAKTMPGSKARFDIRTTDSDGKPVSADLSFGLVDESIYAIRADTTDIAGDLFPRKEDLIQTNFSFPEIYLDGGDKGGGSIPVRRKFQDTAAWVPNVETDREGKGSVQVALPDNVTSWRATCVGVTDQTRVGIATSNLIANKPLMVRVVAPQFMVATDKQSLAEAITNDSGQDLQVKLRTEVVGARITSSPPASIALANGETKTIDLPTETPVAGFAVITSKAWSDNGYSDAVESKFEVRPHGRLVVSNQSGVVSGSSEFKLSLLPNHDPTVGSLQITVAPSIATGLIQSLDSLVQFPYGCVEQTLSRFLPAIRVVKTIEGTPLSTPALRERATKIAVDGFARLQKMQHEDGGWGWWTYDESDPFMTAWVLDGLANAKKCGRTPPAALQLAKALTWAESRLQKPSKTDSIANRLYLLYVLAGYRSVQGGTEILRSFNLDKTGIADLSLAAMAADRLGDNSLREAFLDRIVASLDKGEIVSDPHLWWNADEAIALAAQALVHFRPNEAITTRTIRRLQGRGSVDGWMSTRSTTLATLTLCDFIDSHPETLRSGSVLVNVNGSIFKRIATNPQEPNVPDLRMSVPISSLAPGENRVSVEASGGNPYVALELRQFDVQPQLRAISSTPTLSVSRAYYRMESTRTDKGTMALLPSRQAITSFSSGDVIRCVITIRSAHPIDFLLVEDPLPSNCRVTDREDPMDDQAWSYWWSDLTILDDRVAMFARQTSTGENKLSYTMRAEGAGSSNALPTHVEYMYVPEMNASGSESRIEVSP